MHGIRFDVMVVGGGPSGCAAAISLVRAGRSVAILEKSSSMKDRVGDTLAPEAAPWVAQLGLGDAIRAVPGLEAPGIISIWGGTEISETDFLSNPYGSGRHVDRCCFDAAVAQVASANGVRFFREAAILGFQRSPDAWQLAAAVAGTPTTFVSRWIIDATGRAAWFLRRQGWKAVVSDRLVGVVARVGCASIVDQRLAVEAIDDGWWYTAPLPNGRAVAALMTDSDLLPGRRAIHDYWLQKLRDTRLIKERIPLLDGPRLQIVPASTRCYTVVAGSGWLAVGDAAAGTDPLCGQGICTSLASGVDGAQTLLAAEEGSDDVLAAYQTRVHAAHTANVAIQTRIYNRVADWRNRPFWNRRATTAVAIALGKNNLGHPIAGALR